MKTLEEIRARLAEILDEQRALMKKAEDEKRSDLNDDEAAKYGDLETEYNSLVNQETRVAVLEKREDENKEIEKRFIPGDPTSEHSSDGEMRDFSKFSFGRAISHLVQNRNLDGLELEMHQEGVRQYKEQGIVPEGNFIVPQIIMQRAGHESNSERGIRLKRETRADLIAGTDSLGGYLVQTSVGSLIERLRSKIIIAQLGATQLNGLIGDIQFPVFLPADAAVEKGEAAASAESSPTFGTKTISPNRLPVHSEYSRQLLIQAENESIEAMLRDDLSYQIAKVMDTSAINGSGTPPVPEGILNTTGIGSVEGGTNGLAPSWDNVVTLETEVAQDDADVGSLGYLTNAKARGKMKRVFIDSGSGERIWDSRAGDTPLNGYRVGITNLVPSTLTKGTASSICSAMIFGNFRDIILAQWGGLEFLVNPYALDTTGLIRINAWTFYDILIRRAQSFAATEDLLTT